MAAAEVGLSESRIVHLPADLCAAAEKKFEGVFGSLEELIVFVLNDLSSDVAFKADRAEQKIIEERLKDLGYL